MTEPAKMPGEDLPDTAVDLARAELFAALQRVWVGLGWPAERAHRYPPAGQLVIPCAFVDTPTVHLAENSTGQSVAATFPVVFVTDGSQDSQVRMQDKLLAHGWQQLSAVRLGPEGHQLRATVQTGGPEAVDAGGYTVAGLVFRVQLGLQTRTLCPQPLVQDNDHEEQ